MQPPPDGHLGHAAGDAGKRCPATTPMSRRTAPRRAQIMQKLGYGPDNRADDQGVDPQHPDLSRSGGHPDRPAEGGLYRRRARAGRHLALFPKIMRKEFTDRPQLADQRRLEATRPVLRVCGSSRNWDGYCNPEVDKLIEQQSEAERSRNAASSWSGQIERKLAEDVARPIIFYAASRTCWQPLRQEPDDDGQQHLQRQPPGRRLARQITRRESTTASDTMRSAS